MLKYFFYLFLSLQYSSLLFCATFVVEQPHEQPLVDSFQIVDTKSNEVLEVEGWLDHHSSGRMSVAEEKYFEALKEKEFQKASPYFIYIVQYDMSGYYENELQRNAPELLQDILEYKVDPTNYEPLRRLIDSVAKYLSVA